MRVYEGQNEKRHLKKIVCNQCGREISMRYDAPEEDMFHGESRWGYFSGKDGERHSFDLCEECYDRLVRGFSIPVQIECETEIL